MHPMKTCLPINISSDWTITVEAGSVDMDGRRHNVPKTIIEIPPVPSRSVRHERYEKLPIFNPEAAGYAKGQNLNGVRTEECSATGLLVPDSVQVKLSVDAAPLKVGADYGIDLFWGTFGRLEGGAIGEDQPVFVDYDIVPCRLDSIVVDAAGTVKLVQGRPVVGATCPPETKANELVLANVYLTGVMTKLTDDNLYPVQVDLAPIVNPDVAMAETLLPKTLAKLRDGEELTYVAWGDSVTHAGYLPNPEQDRYHNRFTQALERRFPKAKINHFTAGWPGAGSQKYLDSPRGSEYDFVRDCLERRPDLVTIEFVNDAYLDEAGVQEQYAKIIAAFREIGAEVILIVPHFVRPDWMNLTTQKVDEDPRPYVKGLKQFAAENSVALADASKYWARLWRQGIPYITLENNSINHPDERGHQIFVNALMELFPKS